MERTTGGPPSIGATLLRLRKAGAMSLEQLAARSGVSKSMLSEIERERTNPTVATVWRLAEALGVGMDELIRGGEAPRRGIEQVRGHSVPTITSADGLCVLKILSPIGMAGRLEWYELQTRPGAALVSEPHERGTVEHLSVLDGRLSVESGDETVEAAAGETVRYPADRRHAIRNPGKRPARAILVVAMAGSGRTPA